MIKTEYREMGYDEHDEELHPDKYVTNSKMYMLAGTYNCQLICLKNPNTKTLEIRIDGVEVVKYSCYNKEESHYDVGLISKISIIGSGFKAVKIIETRTKSGLGYPARFLCSPQITFIKQKDLSNDKIAQGK